MKNTTSLITTNEEFKKWEKDIKKKATKLFNWQQNTSNNY